MYSDNVKEESEENTARVLRQVWGLMVVRVVYNTLHRMVYPFLPEFSRGLGQSFETLTQVLTARSLLSALTPWVAVVGDVRGRKFAVLLGLGLFTFGAGLVVIWPTFPVFVLSLMLASIGKFIIDPSLHAYIGDRIPFSRRSLAIGIIEMGWSLSILAGVPLVGFLISRYGWWSPFSFLAFLGFLSLAAVFFVMPADKVGEKIHSVSLDRGQLRVLLNRPYVAGLFVGIFISAANEMFSLVFGFWFEGSLGVELSALGLAAFLIGVAEFGGESLVGKFTDRIGVRKAVGYGIAANIICSLLLLVLGKSLIGAYIGIFLFYLTFEFTLVSDIPMMTELAAGARGTLLAANMAGYALGRAVAAAMAAQVYSSGIIATLIVVVLFNLLALAAISQVRTISPKMSE